MGKCYVVCMVNSNCSIVKLHIKKRFIIFQVINFVFLVGLGKMIMEVYLWAVCWKFNWQEWKFLLFKFLIVWSSFFYRVTMEFEVDWHFSIYNSKTEFLHVKNWFLICFSYFPWFSQRENPVCVASETALLSVM